MVIVARTLLVRDNVQTQMGKQFFINRFINRFLQRLIKIHRLKLLLSSIVAYLSRTERSIKSLKVRFETRRDE